LTLGLGVLGALTMRAGPVTDISSGDITRDYVYYSYSHAPGESDSLTLSGSTGGVDFSISSFVNMTPAMPLFDSTFTDQITAETQLCMPSCVLGTLTLDVQATLNGFSYPYCAFPIPSTGGCHPLGPSSFTGDFTATGSFLANGPGGVDIPLDGVGTTTVAFTVLFDPTGPDFFFAPGSVSYNFIAVPEPSVIFTTGLGLGLLALTRWSRRRAH
jgi:hypothetical protein